ncbi:hypothetical protein V8E51_018821 [Hyaloscypha variabilis]
MPPKKVNRGADAANSTKRKPPPSMKAATPTKKRHLTPDEIPDYDRNISSQASRDRKRFKLSRASIYQDVDIETITKLAENLHGESVYSWGIPKSEPIQASRKKKTRSRITKKTPEEEAYLQMMEDMRPNRGHIIPNSPDRTPILRIPLEIRENIYAYLLIHKRPIMVKEDWTTVERNPFQSHAIIQTCKQFAEEASRFVYNSNPFKAVLRNHTTIFRRREDPVEFHPKYLVLLRNIIIDCSLHCWNLEWFENVAAGLHKLVSAKTVLQSLTLAFIPSRVGITTTALGREFNPVTFADFLWYDGAIMTAIRHLAPKKLNVVIKKSGNKRFLMSVDMTYSQAISEETSLANPETIRLAQAKADIVHEELRGLKGRFEEIFEDDAFALQEGHCRLIETQETSSGSSEIGGSQSSTSSLGGENRAHSEARSTSSSGRESTVEPLWMF